MARNYNKVILIGTIETDLELRQTAKNGTNVTNFSLITVEKRDSKDGEKIYKKWHHIVCWGKLADNIVNTFKKGDVVYVEGSISYRSYVNKENNKLNVTEIKASSINKWDGTGNLNKIILVGNIATDLDLRQTTNGVNVTNFSLNTIDRWKDKEGLLKTHKKWHRLVAWGKTAEIAVNNIKQGMLVLVEGTLSYRTYVNKDNVKNNHVAEIKITNIMKWANPIKIDNEVIDDQID